MPNHLANKEKAAIEAGPFQLGVLIFAAVLLAAGDGLEIIPSAHLYVDSATFDYFHYARGVLAIGVALLAALYLSPVFGWLFLAVFFFAHVPYFFLTFPASIGELITIMLEVTIGAACVGITGRLHRALQGARDAVKQLKHLAGHDVLTGLANRALFSEQTRRAMAGARRNQSKLAILFIDLDDFKNINDSLGHSVGDEVLIDVAHRLKLSVREEDFVGRLGGDEFAVVVQNLTNVENSAWFVERLTEQFSHPISIDGHEIHIGLSIGIAPYPSSVDGYQLSDSAQLLTHADTAMYRAKSRGGNNFEFYDHSMSVEITTKLALINDLQRAIELHQLVLVYQPQVDMNTERIVGVEALLRWNHPVQGLLSPDAFIEVAETSGLITQIGNWVIESACAQNRAWQRSGLPPIRVAVNLSPLQLRRQPIVETVAQALAKTHLNPCHLDLELTENVLMQDLKDAAGALRSLQKLGVSLSVDDFGTGYSSLSCLQQFKVDRLKIDKSFVRNIHLGGDSRVISEAVIKLGHSLGAKIIAEGIEERSEFAYLRALNCDESQGYYHSKPVRADVFAQLLDEDTKSERLRGSNLSVEFY